MKFKNQALSLHSDALPDDTLLVQKLHGEERMSGLFRFELDLICADAELDLEAVLYAPAKLGIKVSIPLTGGQVGATIREITGVFETFEQHEQGQGWVRYRAVLVPKLWQTTRAQRSRVFQEKSIEDLITDVLTSNELDPSYDFEFKLIREGADGDPKERDIYPEREYIVQYEESDWQFLSRWLEHEGIYFFFHNEEGDEKVVFADTESSYAPPLFGGTYAYHPESTGDGGDSDKFVEEEIHTFRCRQQRLPKEVQVTDYNWRIPARLQYSEEVRDGGTGVQAEYNDHYKDEAQGKALAKLRAEELACRAKIFHGTSSCRSFRPGSTFQLADHFRSDWNRPYVLLAVTHDAEQMISTESATVTGTKYSNSFEAIPDDQAWRPTRSTPWPSIKGVINATIDAEGNGHYAELDEHGRYKVIMHYDLHAGDAADGKASRWIRMAQPYAGKNAGMHFPLHKGTEVLITHIDGDPDRPIISGAVPNPMTQSPATGANPTSNSITTPAGNVLQMDDDDSYSGFLWMDARRSVVSDSRQRRKKPGAPADANQPGGGSTAGDQKDQQQDDRLDALEEDPSLYTSAATDSTRTLLDSWRAFFSKTVNDDNDNPLKDEDGNNIPTAFKVLKRHGTLFEDQEKENKNGPTLTDVHDADGKGFRRTGEGTIRLNEANVVAALNYALGKGSEGHFSKNSLSSLENKQAPDTEADGKVGELLENQANAFTGSAKGAQIKVFCDDTVQFTIGDTYKYTDGSNEVSIGTGGNSYSETLANSHSVSVKRGNHTSKSTIHGNEDNTSETHGFSKSESWAWGGSRSMAFRFSGKPDEPREFGCVSFALTASGQSNNSIDLGAFNSNSLFVGAKGGINIHLGGNANVDIDVSAKWKVEVGVAGTYTCKIGSGNHELNANHRTELSLDQVIARLKSSEAVCSRQGAVLNMNMAAIAETKAALAETKTSINENTTALQKSLGALRSSVTCLSHGDTSFSRDAIALSSKSAAAVTMLN